MKDHYVTLDIKYNATQDEIKKSYRKLALKFHPDKHGGEQYYADRFSEIQQAYQILSDVQKKETFDKFLKIYLDEQNGFLNYNEIENIPKRRDYTNWAIAIAAVLVIVWMVLAFKHMMDSRY